jgi:heme/copper-type cytochrome/quinol oxidase subunit 2
MSNQFLISAPLAKLLFGVAVCVCAIAQVAIVRSVARSVPRRRVEMAWAIIPALLLAAVLVMTWRHLSAGA